MELSVMTTGHCTSMEDCESCTALNCTWTGRVYRPCESSLVDMEEVPVVLVRSQSDCPEFKRINTTVFSGEETNEVGNFTWIFCAVVLLAMLLLACLIFRRRAFKSKKTESMIELNDFGP